MYEIIVIGTSWGGLDAVSRLLDGLHDDVHQPIIVAQHRSVESVLSLEEIPAFVYGLCA